MCAASSRLPSLRWKSSTWTISHARGNPNKLELQRDMKSTQRLTVSPILRCAGFVCIGRTGAIRHTCAATTDRRKDHRSVSSASSSRLSLRDSFIQTLTRRRRAICESEAALESPSDCPDSIETAIMNRRLIHGHVRYQ